MAMSASTAHQIMGTYEKMDPADTLLSQISKSYRALLINKRFVTKLALPDDEERSEFNIADLYMPWRDAEKKGKKPNATSSGVQKRKTKTKSPQPKKRQVLTKEQREDAAAKRMDEEAASKAKETWSKEQREEATAKKAEEAEAAALRGVRMSGRARVPSRRVLAAE